MRQKKGFALPLSFAVSAALSLIVVGAVVTVLLTACSVGKDATRLSMSGERDFERLVDYIYAAYTGEDIPETTIIVDEGTAIVGFTAEKKEVYLVEGIGNNPEELCERNQDIFMDVRDAMIERPDECGENLDQTCICRCKTFTEIKSAQQEDKNTEKIYQMERMCGSADCEVLNAELADTGNLFVSRHGTTCFNFENGFVIPGKGTEIYILSEVSYGDVSNTKSRLVRIHPASGGDAVAVCEHPVDGKCIP